MNAQQHRFAQLRLGAQVVALLHSAFRILDPADLDGSFEDWLRIVVPIVSRTRALSARMTEEYLRAARLDSIGFDPAFRPTLAEEIDIAKLRTSMFVTGPVGAKTAIRRGMPLARAMDIAEARSSAAGMRHVLNGGRETLLQTVRADDRAVGWRRITGGKACEFCSMLAARGAVYSADTADFHSHDGCSCSAEPVYA